MSICPVNNNSTGSYQPLPQIPSRNVWADVSGSAWNNFSRGISMLGGPWGAWVGSISAAYGAGSVIVIDSRLNTAIDGANAQRALYDNKMSAAAGNTSLQPVPQIQQKNVPLDAAGYALLSGGGTLAVGGGLTSAAKAAWHGALTSISSDNQSNAQINAANAGNLAQNNAYATTAAQNAQSANTCLSQNFGTSLRGHKAL